MRLRTFTAPDLQDAMKQIRDSMGENAVIINTIRTPGGKGVSVTVAAEEESPEETIDMILRRDPMPEPPRANVISIAPETHYSQKRDRNLLLKEIEKVLRSHNTPDYLVSKLIETSRYVDFSQSTGQDELLGAITALIEANYSFSPLTFERPGTRLMLVGAPGSGKTMTIAKIAAQIVMDRNKVTLISTDSRRAGGIEQLTAFTTILGCELKVAHTRAQMKEALQQCPEESRVLIDSAGSNPYDLDEIRELSEFTAINEIEPVLVLAAGGDANEAEEIARAFSFLGIHKIVVTRADSTRRFGSLLSAAAAADLSFSNISSSPRPVGELKKLTPAMLAGLLMQFRV